MSSNAEQALRTDADGCDAIVIGNRDVSITVVPERGGRVTSLLDRRLDHEWMWRPLGPLRLPVCTPGTPFDESPMVGADECVPTVGPCTTDLGVYPDHGDAWSRAWDCEIDEADGSIWCGVSLSCVPIRVERVIRLRGSRVEFSYRFKNLSDADVPWVWCWHPLLNIPDRPRLSFEGFALRMRPENGTGVPLDGAWEWPAPFEGADLESLDLGGAGRAAKLFLEREGDEPATVVLRCIATGAELAVHFSDEALPALGLWINRGGWNGFRHLAIEPTTAGVERPSDRNDSGHPTHLAARKTVSFAFQITVGRG